MTRRYSNVPGEMQKPLAGGVDKGLSPAMSVYALWRVCRSYFANLFYRPGRFLPDHGAPGRTARATLRHCQWLLCAGLASDIPARR